MHSPYKKKLKRLRCNMKEVHDYHSICRGPQVTEKGCYGLVREPHGDTAIESLAPGGHDVKESKPDEVMSLVVQLTVDRAWASGTRMELPAKLTFAVGR